MIADLMKKRYSARSFLDREIPADLLGAILEAGRLSPSGGNEQPWRFGVITEKSLIKSIAGISCNQTWIEAAPLLIVLCTEVVEDGRGAREIQKRRFPKWKQAIEAMDKELYSCLNLEEHQTKIAGAYMALQALEYGIFSTWVSYFDAEKLKGLLRLPELTIPSEILALGYPDREEKPRPKKDLGRLVFYNIYDGVSENES
jgi:nitroreductase